MLRRQSGRAAQRLAGAEAKIATQGPSKICSGSARDLCETKIIHSFIHSFIHSCIYPFTRSPIHSVEGEGTG